MTQGASEAASDRLHVFASAIDGNIRLVYTAARDNETAAMAIDLMNNARVFFPHTGSPDRTCADRQRIMLSSSSFRGFIRTHSLPTDQAVHDKTQREGRALHFILAEELPYCREYVHLRGATTYRG